MGAWGRWERSSLIAKELDSQHAHPLPRGLALRSETTALRISHGPGVPQGSSNASPDN